MKEHGYSMKLVTRRTGLSPHVIRAWERRYSAVEPRRTDTNRRAYSEADIKRLQLLRQLVEAGHGIGLIAGLPTEELVEMATVEQSLDRSGVQQLGGNEPFESLSESVLSRAERAVRLLESDSLKAALTHASLTMGHIGFIDDLLTPLLERIGDLWSRQEIGIVHEHVASSVIRTFLGGLVEAMPVSPGAPTLIATAPAGQHHELGALLTAVTAATIGWKGVYLGADLPAAEIAAAAHQKGARAVALSLVYPLADPVVASELRVLARSLPRGVTLLAGGRAAESYSQELTEAGAVLFRDLPSLRAHLLRG